MKFPQIETFDANRLASAHALRVSNVHEAVTNAEGIITFPIPATWREGGSLPREAAARKVLGGESVETLPNGSPCIVTWGTLPACRIRPARLRRFATGVLNRTEITQ